jgi:DNA-binding transcriptional regulator YiaG
MPKPAKARLMTGAEFAEALDAIGMSHTDFATRAGWQLATVQRWTIDKIVPPYVAWLVELLVERHELLERLRKPAE